MNCLRGDSGRSMFALIIAILAGLMTSSLANRDITNKLKAATNDCTTFMSACTSRCNGAYRTVCGWWNDEWHPETKCLCTGVETIIIEPQVSAAVYTQTSKATEDLRKTVTDCEEFENGCIAGCYGAWSVLCYQTPESPTTYCNCGRWVGIRPSKKEQDEKAFDNELLKTHNQYRQQHGASPVVYDKKLKAKATKWAKYLASIDKSVHSPNPGYKYGENIYNGSGIVEGQDPVNLWYDEINIPGYNFTTTGMAENPGTLHLSQVLWISTKQVGCGRNTSATTGTVYVVCNYYPMGNFLDQFADNVLPPVDYALSAK